MGYFPKTFSIFRRKNCNSLWNTGKAPEIQDCNLNTCFSILLRWQFAAHSHTLDTLAIWSSSEFQNKLAKYKLTHLPIKVWFILIYINIVQWIHAKPGVKRKPILIRPLGNRRQCNCLWKRKAEVMGILLYCKYHNFIKIQFSNPTIFADQQCPCHANSHEDNEVGGKKNFKLSSAREFSISTSYNFFITRSRAIILPVNVSLLMWSEHQKYSMLQKYYKSWMVVYMSCRVSLLFKLISLMLNHIKYVT